MKVFTWLTLLLIVAASAQASNGCALDLAALVRVHGVPRLSPAQLAAVRRTFQDVDGFLGKLERPPHLDSLTFHESDLSSATAVAWTYGYAVGRHNLNLFFGRDPRVLARERLVAGADPFQWRERRSRELEKEIVALREEANRRLEHGETLTPGLREAFLQSSRDVERQISLESAGRHSFADFILRRPNYEDLVAITISALEQNEPQSGSETDYLGTLAPVYAFIGKHLHGNRTLNRATKLEIVFDAVGEELVERYLRPELDAALENHPEAANRRLMTKMTAKLPVR